MDYVQQNATYTSGSYSNIQHMHHQQLHQQDYNQPAQTSTHSYQSQPQTQYSTQNYQQQNYAQPQQNQQEYGYNNNSQTWNISQNKASYIVSIMSTSDGTNFMFCGYVNIRKLAFSFVLTQFCPYFIL